MSAGDQGIGGKFSATRISLRKMRKSSAAEAERFDNREGILQYRYRGIFLNITQKPCASKQHRAFTFGEIFFLLSGFSGRFVRYGIEHKNQTQTEEGKAGGNQKCGLVLSC